MIVKIPEIPHDVLGITPTMQPRTVILKQMIYLVEHWRPATVPTEANPGHWETAIPAYEGEGDALAYIASLPEEHRPLYRVRPALAYTAREVWAEPGDRRPPRREGATLLACARAWAGAIERQDIAEIERCANELILAVARCGG